MRRAAAALLLLAGCHHPPPAPGQGVTPGDRIERAAIAAGVVNPGQGDPVGLYAREGDRVCVVGDGRGGYRVGALVALDERHGCVASGAAAGGHGRVRARFGDGCRADIALDGDRLTFPAALAPACDRFCRGGASLAALNVERLSSASAEAAALRDPRGRLLCGG